MTSEKRLDWSLQYCSDGVFVPASSERVFDSLLDIAGWNRWWETMRFDRPGAGPLQIADRVVFEGGASRWIAEVTEIERPHRIAFRYAEGSLLGDTEWRVTPQPGGCRAEYVYLGVKANDEGAAATFGRFGTELHTMVMQADALAGLVRLVAGEPLDAAWHDEVRAALKEGRASLVDAG